MIRRPPRSTLFSLHDALPIWLFVMPRNRSLLQAHKGTVGSLLVGASPQHGLPTVAVLNCLTLLGRAEPYTKDRKSTRLNSSHANISYAVFCLKKKKKQLLCIL